MADTIAVINFGKVEQVGTPEDVFERPINTFVPSLVLRSKNWPKNALPCARPFKRNQRRLEVPRKVAMAVCLMEKRKPLKKVIEENKKF